MFKCGKLAITGPLGIQWFDFCESDQVLSLKVANDLLIIEFQTSFKFYGDVAQRYQMIGGNLKDRVARLEHTQIIAKNKDYDLVDAFERNDRPYLILNSKKQTLPSLLFSPD